MAVPQLGTKTTSGMIYEAALIAGDSSSVSGSGLSDAQWTLKVNDAYYWWVTEFEKRTESKTLVSSFTANTWTAQTAVTANDPEILEVSVAIGSAPTATRTIEWMPWAQIRWLQARKIAEGGTLTATYPQFYSLQKESGQSNRWRIAVFPAPPTGGAYQVNGRVRVHPTALSSSTDTPDLDDFGARCVIRIAAAWGAEDIGQSPERVDRILRALPEFVRAKMTRNRDLPDPNRRSEAPAR